MNQDEQDFVRKFVAKLLTKIDDDMMKNILLAMILMADPENGQEFKSLIKQKLIEKL